ncbi:TadE/TadG family type IV pilus assembly protein [Aeromicrobium terrae]|uniref:Pilus assembly protein n=1 Tax=Aeromicrobium terrae TaxID=2498846 RepID=A0A5C8NMH5_9ACTN|nr:TadE/TadG family type IV pilus assembly protein [Aeromicrobium terrae]TXL62125.1 pilus assembly protein [Aeromicrobium terrae]
MRELIRILNHPRDERGVSAVFFGLALSVLVGALGLSVDVGNVAYERTRAQHAADTAARQLAFECAKRPTGTTCAALQSSAASIASESFDGGTVTATKSGSAVTVSVAKTIATNLLALVGVPSKDVAATATANIGLLHPTESYPVLPLGVGYCTWKNYSGGAGTSSETNAAYRINLRTDTLQSVRTLLSPLTGTLSTIVGTDWLLNALGTSATDSCTDVDGTQLLTFKGATWLTGENVVGTVLSSLFSWDGPSCELKVAQDLSTFLGGVEGAAFFPSACASRFGPGKKVDVGKTILLPVYKPNSTAQNKMGFKLLSACVGLGSVASAKPATCLEVPPKIGVKIVGFAPFKVTGWTFPSTPSGYTDSTAGCSALNGSFGLYTLVNGTFTILEKLLNVVTGLLNALLGVGPLTFSIACNGLQGYFTKSFTKDPNTEYGTGGADLGATYATLTH